MCRKTIYHNTYIDGDRDVTERVDCCTPGRMCAAPKIREVHRQLPYIKAGHSSSPGRASPAVYDRDMYPPTPLSNSPSPRPDGGERSSKYHKRGQDIYVGGTRMVEVNDHSGSGSRRRRGDRRPVVLESSSTQGYKPYAPEPPSPRPIPIKRSSTMTYGIDTPPREETRGRRPIIVEERVPSRRNPSVTAPVDVFEHSSAPRLSRRNSSRRDSAYLAPSSRLERSPQGYASAEDERERHERRRIRHERRAQAAAMASSAPTSHQEALYGSSYGSSSYASSPSSGFTSSPKFSGEPSAAVHEVKKHLRWEDQMRAKQNAKIDSRPKLSRSNTTGGGGVQTEVKSILKNAGEGQVPAAPKDGMAELYSSMEGLGIRGSSASRPSSREKQAQRQEDREEAEYQERLRSRFNIPPRRYTSIGPKRRSEVWYPDEGRYKYL
ncbi:uncharacterized protein E0L32_008639 [Thyridium curvatum]|uniref:Uncharacterized protein n=1 Tax=Thyridium curvatum TaxID=1093900 RepID=A0A507B1J2_9PEZI|nr:uncharacterized protein E0L32_008639 [Thyridium curvatum]TPX10420.1 hypothetical protein E0L32_008639 [Thyridium curvatum]